MFCKHNWKEIAKTFSGTAKVSNIAGGVNPEEIERLVFGVTTIIWECQKCHKLRKEELLGKENKCP